MNKRRRQRDGKQSESETKENGKAGRFFFKFAMESKAEKNCRNAHLPNDLL